MFGGEGICKRLGSPRGRPIPTPWRYVHVSVTRSSSGRSAETSRGRAGCHRGTHLGRGGGRAALGGSLRPLAGQAGGTGGSRGATGTGGPLPNGGVRRAMNSILTEDFLECFARVPEEVRE